MSFAAMGQSDSCLTIDLGAIIANWRYIDSLSSTTTTTAAMVKANGYGLGAKNVAEALANAGCTEFFVAILARPLLCAIILMSGVTNNYAS